MIDSHYKTTVEEHEQRAAAVESRRSQIERYGEPNDEPLELFEARKAVAQLAADDESMGKLIGAYVAGANAWRSWHGTDNAVSRLWSQLISGAKSAHRELIAKRGEAVKKMERIRDDFREKCGLSRLGDLT